MSMILSSAEEGELVLVRLRVASRQLEDVLEALAALPFPVNPDLHHVALESVIEFPAYTAQLAAVHAAMAPFELAVETTGMLQAIRGM